MDPDLSPLDAYLDEGGFDGYLVNDSSDNADQRYLSGYYAGDPFITLYDGGIHVLVGTLEYSRAKVESRADTVSRWSDFDYQAKAEEYGPHEGGHRLVAEFLRANGVESVAVPNRFPLGPADGLRERGVEVTPDEDNQIEEIRAVKTPEEIEHVRATQRANEIAMEITENLIREATVGDDGLLYRDDEPLTSEAVRSEIEIAMLRRGYSVDDTIVACGESTTHAHDRGSGPLRANEAIIVDIFPRSKETGYYADMTRSFVKGDAGDTLRDWYELTHEALEAALAVIEPGVPGEAIHGAVCDVYEDAGHPTLRSDEDTETGFIHATGHGVGLDIHEAPSVSTRDDEIEAGHVITVEPGLYDPEVGGVRIEDIVVVTEDGYENLTEYPRGIDTYELP